MFQTTRRRLALWYTAVTAVLLLLFATGFYLYVRTTLVERVDDTLSHVVEVVERSLVIDPSLRVNIEASFRSQAADVEDDHIDLEWFSPTGELLWSTFTVPPSLPLHFHKDGETVHGSGEQLLRQITQRVIVEDEVLGVLRVSHPWFEVTKPSRQLIRDLGIGIVLIVVAVGAIGWFLSGLAIAPVRDSYQRLKQFTADASHELRNPIAVIQTNVQVALADPDPTLQQDQLRVVERLTRRLGRLVDDLLFLARQDSGMIPLKIDTVDLKDLLTEVVEEQQAIATEKDLKIHLHLEQLSEPYLMQGDRTQLSRLFTNLVSNAVQYSQVGKIEVILKRQNAPQLQVEVKDTGIGIAADALPQIFDRFYRADPARTSLGSSAVGSHPRNSSGGSGLGLAIAQVITENHQGQIQVESQINQGTTVTVTFPASDMG
jgi:two-component system, OmpR family, manganese sensing sensor histidine kinase